MPAEVVRIMPGSIDICSGAYSSHLNPHLKEMVPVYLNSTVCVGFDNSRVFSLVVADGLVAVIRRDSDSGSDDS